MATFGVLVPASPGHLNPMGALGRELVRRGHRVVVSTLADAEPAARAAGLEFVPFGLKLYPPGSLAEVFAELGRRQGFDAFRYTVSQGIRWTRALFDDAFEALEPFAPDLLVIDQAILGSPIAERLGVPFVGVANALPIDPDPSVPIPIFPFGPPRGPVGRLGNRLLRSALFSMAGRVFGMQAEYRRAHGLRPKPRFRDWFSDRAEVWQLPAELDYPAYRPPTVHHVGPLRDRDARAPVPFPFERLDGRPLIYASLGTIQNRLLRHFRAIAEACAPLDAQLVLSLGGSADPEVLGPLPGDPIVVRAAPQLELLEQASLTITHAGMNTTLESLAEGVPIVAIPITNDQPGVAARVKWSGTGLVVPPRRLTAPRLREAIQRVRGEPTFRERARDLRAAIARAGGVPRAADVIERVLATGAPVRVGDV